MGKFVMGFLVGAAVGAGVALLLAAEPQAEGGVVASLQSSLRHVLDEARRAASQREQELWREFHNRVPQVSDQATL